MSHVRFVRNLLHEEVVLVQVRFSKNETVEKMTENLRVLRNKLNLTQNELAQKIGISRQTLVNIENKKRIMTWNSFVALTAVFRAERSTSDLLEYFGIYTSDLKEFLVSPSRESDEDFNHDR